ncbi:MAG: MFS transporter [Pirellula sp.]
MANKKESTAMSTAWVVVALLVPVAFLNYLDRQMLASMKTSVMSDVSGLANEADWGKVLAMFKWTYAFLSPVGGLFADRFGRRYVIAGSLFVWSLVTCLTGMVTTYEQLLIARSLMGISEAFYIQAALALISDYHIGPTRSKAVGFHQMGIYAGVIVGGFTGYAADSPSFGWRWTFGLFGLIGVIYAIPLLLLLKDRLHSQPVKEISATGDNTSYSAADSRSDSQESSRDQQTSLDENPYATSSKVSHENQGNPKNKLESPPVFTQSKNPLEPYFALLVNPSFLLLVAYFTLPAMAAWVVRDWMPAILKKEFNIGQGMAGVSATLYWQVAAIFGAIVGGALADRWMQQSNRGRIYVSAIGMSLIVPAMFGVGYAPQTGQLWIAVAFLVLFGLGWGFFDCNNMPILCQIARPQHRATGYGIMNLVSISCGGFADVAFGVMKDQNIPLFGIFSVFASVAILSILLVLLIRPRYSDETGY